MGARRVSQYVLLIAAGFAGAACELLPQLGDTDGVQHSGEWDQHGRIVVDTDPTYTLVRLRIDTTSLEGHDVVLARFDFDPSDALGDEYSLDIALDLGDAHRLASNQSYSLGHAIPAYATVTCLCRPLRSDSVRGKYVVQTRGSRQIAGRIDATLYFTAWNDSSRHATFRLKQRIHGVRP